MIKNRKGFMLVEVVITSTVVLTALAYFYSEFNNLYVKYDEKNSYHDIDGLYATKELINYFIANDNFDFNNYIAHVFNNGHYGYIIKEKAISLDIGCPSTDTVCTGVQSSIRSSNNINAVTNVMNFYEIKNMIITEYDKCYLDKSLCKNSSNSAVLDETYSIKGTNINKTFKDYIDYVISYYNIEDANVNSTSNVYNYIVLTEIEKSDGKVYYSNMRLR